MCACRGACCSDVLLLLRPVNYVRGPIIIPCEGPSRQKVQAELSEQALSAKDYDGNHVQECRPCAAGGSSLQLGMGSICT